LIVCSKSKMCSASYPETMNTIPINPGLGSNYEWFGLRDVWRV